MLCAALPLLLLQGDGPKLNFVDIAARSGLVAATTFGGKQKKDYILEVTGTGATIFDFDGDGANDIFMPNGTTMGSASAATPSFLYRNDGKGHFTDVAKQAGLTRSGWAQAGCAADFDNDGDTDLFVTYYGQNSLYRNDGKGHFTDVAETAGLTTPKPQWGAGCAFVDYDRDGYVDIFISSYVELDMKDAPSPANGKACDWKGLRVMCGPVGLPMGHNSLYRNNGNGTFTNVTERAGILKPGGRYGLGVVAADFNNDGWPDIYVACDQTPSLLYSNLHDGTFEEIGSRSGAAFNADGRLQAGMGVAVADFEGTGFLGIAKTNFSGDRPSLYRNENGNLFEDISEPAGLWRHQLLGWGIVFTDVNDDGLPDLAIANGHVYPEVTGSAVGETYKQKTLLYLNRGQGKFEDATAVAGPGFAPMRPSRGMAAGDLDGDGRPEIIVVNMNEPPALLKNLGPRGNWIAFALEGKKSNRSAIGARVTVEADGRRQMQEVSSGGSYFSQNSTTLYFGLGKATKVDRLEIKWPSGETQTWTAVPGQRTVRIAEGSQNVQ
ncbi:MAG: ASPIC/UnbV domain protein [Bryobacterales bacterium]|nr:ASPIC/UnbV domain protein [Bryobacterales bacterium]